MSKHHIGNAEYAGLAKLVDARDLKSCGISLPYRFESGIRHQNLIHLNNQYIAEWSSPVARWAHNPKVRWFKSPLRNHERNQICHLDIWFFSILSDAFTGMNQ